MSQASAASTCATLKKRLGSRATSSNLVEGDTVASAREAIGNRPLPGAFGKAADDLPVAVCSYFDSKGHVWVYVVDRLVAHWEQIDEFDSGLPTPPY